MSDDYYNKLDAWLSEEIWQCQIEAMKKPNPAIAIIKKRGIRVGPGKWRIRDIVTYTEFKEKHETHHLEWRYGGQLNPSNDDGGDTLALINIYRNALSVLVRRLDDFVETKDWKADNHFAIEEIRCRGNDLLIAISEARELAK